MGVGYDKVDRVALAKRGVMLCNVPGMQAVLRFEPTDADMLHCRLWNG